eukprot:SAG31_NODE_18640_length_628_cov_1.332703_1_plen_34_part_10
MNSLLLALAAANALLVNAAPHPQQSQTGGCDVCS